MQVQRITELRERRSEEARLRALEAEREASERATAAKARLESAKATESDARSAFFEHHGNSDSEAWMIASQMREEHALGEARIADEKRDLAREAAVLARQEHEKLRERACLLNSRIDAVSRDIHRRADDRDEEDAEECRA